MVMQDCWSFTCCLSWALGSSSRVVNFSFYNSSRLSYEARKYQKINLLSPKGSSNSDNMNILSVFIFLLSLNFLRKLKNDPHLKIILTSVTFLDSFFIGFQNLRIGWNLNLLVNFLPMAPSKKQMKLIPHISRVNWTFLQYLNLDSKTIIHFSLYYYYFRVILV